MTLLLRASLRQLARHPAQSGLAVLGVALGVALVVAVDLARGSAERAFLLATETLQGRTTHVVRGGPAGLPESLYATLLRELDVVAAPVVEAPVAVTPPGGGRRRTLTLFGVDPFSERAFRGYLAAGATVGLQRDDGGSAEPSQRTTDPQPRSAPLDLRRLLVEPATCLLARDTAGELGLGMDGRGGRLEVVGARGSLPVDIVGLLVARDDSSRIGMAGLLACDLATAQELLGWAAPVGRLSRIDLLLPAGAAGSRQLAAIEAVLARAADALQAVGAVLEPAGSQSRTTLAMTRAFRANLLALALLALVCGTFLIFNTVSFSVVQRRAWIGRLRALGTTRGEIGRLILGEALVLGVVGSGLGLVGGVVLGQGLVGLVTRTIQDLYFRVAVSGVTLAPSTLLFGFALGVGATLLAAAWPAQEATTAPPRLVQQRSALESTHQQRAPRLALAGVVLLAVGLLGLRLGSSLEASFAGVFAVLVGAALLVPLLVLAAARLLAPPLGWLFGGLGAMAARGLAASLSRTGIAVAALAVAMAVAVGVGLMIDSFRSSVERWLGTTLQADLYVTPSAGGPGNAAVRMDPQLVAALERLPGVARMNRLRAVTLSDVGGNLQVVALDMDRRSERAFEILAGDEATLWPGWRSGRGVLISEPLATKRGLAVGATLRLPGDRGAALPVLGIYRDYASDQGAVLIDLALYRARFGDDAVSAVSLFAGGGAGSTGAPDSAHTAAIDTAGAPAGDPTVDPKAAAHDRAVAALAAAVRRLGEGRLGVQSNHDLRRVSLAVFDRTFTVTAVLRLLTAGVAFAGVLAALLALALERQRELGVLRALGLLPRQVFAVVTGQTALLGLVAGLVALPLGAGLAAIMVHVINRRSFGWSMQLGLDPGRLAEAVLLALVAAVVAGLYPAWRMSRTSPAEALRTE